MQLTKCVTTTITNNNNLILINRKFTYIYDQMCVIYKKFIKKQILGCFKHDSYLFFRVMSLYCPQGHVTNDIINFSAKCSVHVFPGNEWKIL